MGRRYRRGPRTLAPLLRDRWSAVWRGGGFGRTMLLRRAAAAALVLLAAVLALSPAGATSGETVLVATTDLAAGTVLEPAAVQVRSLPDGAVPDGALRSADAAIGRTLAAPLRRGEPVTDVRLAGAALARAVAADPDAVSVPLRLADEGVARLLHPGAVVDVVTLGERQDVPVVLARDAEVLAVLAAGDGGAPAAAAVSSGPLVLVALDPDAATRVAGASLSAALTVTFR